MVQFVLGLELIQTLLQFFLLNQRLHLPLRALRTRRTRVVIDVVVVLDYRPLWLRSRRDPLEVPFLESYAILLAFILSSI